MRIYLPLAVVDREVLAAAGTRLEIAADRYAWGVGDEARADRPGWDEEDLEYEALQDAVFHDLTTGGGGRALVAALDVADDVLRPEPGIGAFGWETTAAVTAPIAALHVTEQDARAAEADDTDPAVLWFDAREGRAALDYARDGRLPADRRD